VGVDVFFVISGYLITSIILRELSQGKFSIVKFYERRARRILPALFFVILCCAPFAYFWLLPDEFRRFGQSLIAVATFASNVYFWLKTDYFAPDAENELLLHTWSLAVEEQYYVLFPIFLMLLWKYSRHRLFWSTAIVAAISFAFCEWAWRNDAVLNFYLLPSRAWELLVGSLVALWMASDSKPAAKTRLAREMIVGTGLAAIVVSTLVFDDSTPFPSYYAAIPTLGTALIIAFGSGQELTCRFLSWKPVVFIGLISYSAYLWHQPIFALLRIRGFGEFTEIHFLIGALASLLLATLTWQFVEKPFRSRSASADKKPTLTRNMIFGLSATGICVFLLAGTVMIYQGRDFERSSGLQREQVPQGCLRLPRPGDDRCKMATVHNDADTVVALWGDSFADAFSMSLYAQGRSESVTVYPFIFHSCPSLIGTVRNEDYRLGLSFSESCAKYTDRISRHIAELRPDVVVLTSAYEFYSSEINPHNGKPILISQDSKDRSGLDVVLDSLHDTIEFLNNMDVTVVLVTPHPRLKDFNMRRRMAKLFGHATGSLDLDPDTSQELTARILSRLNESDLRFHVVSPTRHICARRQTNAKECSAIDQDGSYLLYDGSHVTRYLARKISEDIFAAIDSASD
jgi:peptidoglycan/LPS O-acetylase OafA/YrhL